MLPEQQQRIMGYFIEEAKDHLNTIEQGLLSLQSTIEDPERANEVFRAAHSVKGGAAMLGLESIQKTAHRMEDYFKVLKEAPVQVDRTLETMFLRISDGLKDLLEELEGPFGLTQDKAQEIMTDVEPVFDQLASHLDTLVAQSGSNTSAPVPSTSAATSPDDLKARFKRDVATLLRQLLATFKQADTPETRQSIQSVCAQLTAIGEQFELSAWCDLVETARIASANLENDYRTLAPTLIKEIKKAQDLVLSGRASEVAVSDAMQALLPEDILATVEVEESTGLSAIAEDDLLLEASVLDAQNSNESELASDTTNASEEDLGGLFFDEAQEITASASLSNGNVADSSFEPSIEAGNDDLESLFDGEPLADDVSDDIAELSFDLDFDEIPKELSTLNRDIDSSEEADESDESMDALLATVNVTGPDVGKEELNSLADLFDGDLDELDNTLGGHAFVSEEMQLNPEKIDLSTDDDLTDLLSNSAVDETPSEILAATAVDDDLFGGTLTEGEFASVSDSLADVDSELSDLEDSLFQETDVQETDVQEIDQEADLVIGDNVAQPEASLIAHSDGASLDDEANFQSAAQTDMDADMALLSEDIWSNDELSNDELSTEGSDDSAEVSQALSMGALETDFVETDSTVFASQVAPSDVASSDLPASDLADIEDLMAGDLSAEESAVEELTDFEDTLVGDDSVDDANLSDSLELASSLQSVSLDDLEEGFGLENSLLDAIADDTDLEATNLEVAPQDIEPNSFGAGSANTGEQSAHNEPALEKKKNIPPESTPFEHEDLNIEFPTLTGVELQQAEEDIDSFFLDAYTDTSGENPAVEASELELDALIAEPETDKAKDKAADDSWGELAIDESAHSDEPVHFDELLADDSEETVGEETVGEKTSDEKTVGEKASGEKAASEKTAIEKTSHDLDALFDVSLEDTSNSVANASSVEDLWEEMITPTESTDATSADSDVALDLAAAFLEEDGVEEDGVEEDATNEKAIESEEEANEALADEALVDEELADEDLLGENWLSDADGLLSDSAEQHDTSAHDTLSADISTDEDIFGQASLDDAKSAQAISGEEISDEVLAEFQTAFGAQPSQDEETSSAINGESSLTTSDEDDFSDAFDGFEDDSLLEQDALEEKTTGLEHSLKEYSLEEHSFEERSPEAVSSSFEDDFLGLGSSDLELGDLPLSDESKNESLEPESELNAADLLFTAQSETALDAAEHSSEESLAEADLTSAFDDGFDEFDNLESLLSDGDELSEGDEFDAENESALGDEPTYVGDASGDESDSDSDSDDDFGDLERLLEEGDTVTGAAPSAAPRRTPQRTARRGGSAIRDQNMRVSVKHLDNLSNLVGELVVSRNTLERDQERLRQFLDNLLFQVQQLNDVGQRMRDLYERSLLESSLMSNRRSHSADSANGASKVDKTVEEHATGATFDALEMDRFTGFHTLSQEMIELIVRVRESSSDIGYTVESSDQVTRQFRQITTQLQEGLNTARMVAFAQAADRLPRAVRDISLKCGKEARLIVEGQDTLIDKMIVEHLYDPLTHLVNNAITHGIETPEARKAAGKLPEGSITVRAFYQGNQTVIYVADDGGGINTEFVKKKAIEKQLITAAEAEGLSDIETYDLLFHPGFSTRDQADDFAGRGVGMDVVRTSLAEIRGSVTIDSELGRGTSFTIRLPLTLSISKALSCVSNQARIAFPMDGVEDMLDVPRDRVVKNEEGQDCVRWRDKVLPFQPVTNLLKFNRTLGRGRVYGGSQDDDVLSVIVLRSANTFVAVQVDQVIGEQEIVIKQLEGPVPKPLGIAGATVLGDGRVMPIADVLELIDIAMGRVRREPTSMMWADTAAAEAEAPAKNEPTVLIVDDSITVRELLSMSFNKVGYRVEQARDGQEAWDKLRSGLPCDLVFCDIEMPRMDGLELLSRMQKDNHLKTVPIAMLTSRGADRHRQMAVDLGASGYFTKPYLEEALLDAAQRMLNGETLAKGRGG